MTREVGDVTIVLGPRATDRMSSLFDRAKRGRAYLVVSPSVSAAPAGARVTEALGDRLVGTYARVRPHVPIDSVEEAFLAARARSADIIVGFGGGSPIGTAKAVAARLQEARGAPDACVVAALPTTYAGSEMTATYGTTDVSLGKKTVVRNPSIRPRIAVYDPELAVDTPPRLSASTGINALAHCVEGLYSKSATDEDRALARRAAATLIERLPRCTAAPRDLFQRYKMFEGSMEAGLVLASAGMGLHHGVCHVLGGRYNAPHGELNAVILPHAMRFNLAVGVAAYPPLAPALGVPTAGRKDQDVAEDVCRAMSDFVRRLGLPQRLRDLGIERQGLEVVALEALSSAAVRSNPIPVADYRQVLDLLEAAW